MNTLMRVPPQFRQKICDITAENMRARTKAPRRTRSSKRSAPSSSWATSRKGRIWPTSFAYASGIGRSRSSRLCWPGPRTKPGDMRHNPSGAELFTGRIWPAVRPGGLLMRAPTAKLCRASVRRWPHSPHVMNSCGRRSCYQTGRESHILVSLHQMPSGSLRQSRNPGHNT